MAFTLPFFKKKQKLIKCYKEFFLIDTVLCYLKLILQMLVYSFTEPMRMPFVYVCVYMCILSYLSYVAFKLHFNFSQ